MAPDSKGNKQTPKDETGHSDQASLGLAKKTVQEVLGHFGETPDEARVQYRAFVEKGIAMGRRPDLMRAECAKKGILKMLIKTDSEKAGSIKSTIGYLAAVRLSGMF